MPSRCFTPARARRTAERLRPTLLAVRALFGTLERRRPAAAGPEQLVDPSYFRLVARLHRLLADVRRSGAVVADVRHGGVRFPARLDGRAVLLCWRPDDGRLRWSVASGQGPLRPVDEQDDWEEA